MGNRKSAALVAASVIGIVGALALVLLFTAHVDLSFGHTDGRGSTRISIAILLFGAVQGLCLYASMVAIALDTYRARERMSRLFWPIFAVKVAIACQVVTSAAQGVDLLLHDLHPHWMPLYSASFRIAQNLFLLGVFASLTWLHATLLLGWGWGKRRVWLLIVAMATFAATTMASLVLYAHYAN